MKNIHSQNQTLKTYNACLRCVTRNNCINACLSNKEVETLNNLYVQRINLGKGDSLYHNGDRHQSIFNIRAGILKMEHSLEDGRQQLIRFCFPGELTGLDGLQDGQHHTETTALVDSEICCINFDQFRKISTQYPSLQKSLDQKMSLILNDIQDHIFLLGCLSSNEKLAHFLIEFSKKIGIKNQPVDMFKLPMNREELSSYLGMTVETLSRTFTYMSDNQIILARNKNIKILSFDKLNRIKNSS